MDDAVNTSRRGDDIGDAEAPLMQLPIVTSGATFAYSVLDDLARAHRLTDALLVLQPQGTGLQIFRHGRNAIEPEAAAAALARGPGLYTDPDVVPAGTRTTLAAMCALSFDAQVARLAAAVDPSSGLAGRDAIAASLARAAACSARYGWGFTAILLTTAGVDSSGERWLALCDALRTARRSGDEVGVAGRGVALALLGNAGPDVARPFVARVRAALTDAGADDVDLLAATACAPDETIDPAELRRLAGERLAEVTGSQAGPPEPADPAEVEMALRAIPGVVCVGTSPGKVSVVVTGTSDALHDAVTRRVREDLDGVALTILDAGAAPAPATWTPPPPPVTTTAPNGNGACQTPPILSAAAPGSSAAGPSGPPGFGADRVTLVSATFDPDRGVSEVRLALGHSRGTGRVPAGPLAGGAQATLTALGALGFSLPFYLVSAERAHGIPGDPVVVVLAPRRSATPPRLAERIGVASGRDDVEAASRATLGALNRHLAGAGAGRTETGSPPPASTVTAGSQPG